MDGAARRQIHFVQQLLASIDPSMGARALFMRGGITATFAGEGIMIWKCQTVIPDFIYWDYQVNNK